MNVKQAAKKWSVSESAVRKYCNLKLISTCKKVGREWIIEDDALCPYTKLGNVKKSNDYIYIVIINSLMWNKTVLSKNLGIDDSDLQDYFDNLERSELISIKTNCNNKDIFKNYIIMPSSKEYLKKNKDFSSETIGYIFSALSIVTTIATAYIK